MNATTARKTRQWVATPRQLEFLGRTEYEALYGGSKMGLKTDALLMWAIRRRTKYANSRGLFIRREITEIVKQGAAWDRIQEILGNGVRYNQTDHKVLFPNGSVQEFGHCHDESDKFHYQGAQYDDECVLRGTLVLMGDGRWKPVEAIQVGEMVATLEGARPVTRLWSLGKQPVCCVQTPYGSVVISATQGLMLADGAWASPNELLSSRCGASCISESGSLQKPQSPSPQLSSQCLGRSPAFELVEQGSWDTRWLLDSSAWSEDGRSDCGASASAPPAAMQQEKWIGQIMLLSRVLPLGGLVDGEDRSALPYSSLQGFPIDCPGGRGSGDGRVLSGSVAVLDGTQPQADAGAQIPCSQHSDGRESTHAHSQRSYVHPYTKETRDRVEDVRPVEACIVRAGVGEVFDLTVASASHFIVFPGIIARNCFDQLEQFTDTQYSYIKGACRVPNDNPPTDAAGNVIQARIRCSANPGDVGHVWVKAYFIDVCASGQPYTYTSVIDAPDGSKVEVTRDRVFIPASVFDSVQAGIIGLEYVETLNQMPEPYRSAYLYGLWDVFIGQAFLDFRPLVDGKPYHVIDYEPLPLAWRRVAGHDWGYDAPMYTLWGALDPLGGITIYRELWARNWDPEEIATQNLLAQGGEKVSQTFSDPSIWASYRARLTQEQVTNLRESGQLQLSIADQYAKSGWHMQPGNNDRLAGKMAIHRALKERPDGVPWLRVMQTCPRLIATMQQIQLDPKRTEDVETDYPADAPLRDEPYDALRYLLMGLTELTTMPVERRVSTTIHRSW